MIDQAGIVMAHGKTIACEQIQGVNDNMAQSHYHDYFEIYYLESGSRIHVIHDQLYHIKPGELVIFSPYVMHYSFGEKDAQFKRIVLYFREEEITSTALRELLKKGTGVYQPSSEVTQNLQQMLHKLLQEQAQDHWLSEDCMHHTLNLMLLEIARQIQKPLKPEKRKRFADVIRYIHEHYHEDINLECLAKEFFISPYYLCREFKSYTNTTVIHYLNITRIMNAQYQLMETPKNITEISKATGFSNVTHFNRVFKEVTGMTPSGYRKQYKKRMIHQQKTDLKEEE